MLDINHVVTKEFYEKILNKAIQEAGPKYTPGLYKDAPNLEIEELLFTFDILGRTKKFYEYLRSLSDELRKENALNYSVPKIFEFKIKINKKRLKALCENINQLIMLLKTDSEKYDLKDDIDLKSLNLLSRKSSSTIRDIEICLFHERNDEKPKEKDKDKDRSETVDRLIYEFRRLGDVIYKIENFCYRPGLKLANNPFLLLLGEAGIGKTHFLCDIAKKRINEGYPTLLLLGHYFQQVSNPTIQITKILGFDTSFKRIIQKLNKEALKTKCRCLVMIDAINEGNKEAWKKNLNSFIKELDCYKHIGLVLSCRIPFERITIPAKPKPKLITVIHPGFREIELNAQSAFFNYYKIPTPEVPILVPEFSNPLFLKLFCKSIEKATIKKKHRQIKDIASGQKGMTYIFEFFVKERGNHIEKSFGLSRGYTWNNVFKKIAEEMAESKKEWLSKKEIEKIVNIKKANGFINKLISEGMLHETLEWENGGEEPIEAIRFPYQKFSDHIIARYLSSKYLKTTTDKEIRKSLTGDSYLGSLFKEEMDIYSNSGIIEALMIEFPTRIKIKGELFDFLDKKEIQGALVEAFINGLIWHDPKSINDSTNKWVNIILNNNHFKNDLLDILVALSTKPKHPFNAMTLNRFLKNFKMNKRDLFWSEFLRKQYSHTSIYRILKWIEMTKATTLGKDYAQMYLITLMWTLTSTNRPLRDRATRAIYYVGCKYPEILFALTLEALELNDPYVPERMLAASYGVAMANQNNDDFTGRVLREYARSLYELMFKKNAKYSTTHILMRDYAKHTIDLALKYDPKLLNRTEQKRIVPPYKDGGIRRWRRSEDRNEGEFGAGSYPFGLDFDNYTLGSLVPGRSPYDSNHPEYIKVKSNMWWRIYKLGYSLKDFGEIDMEIARYNSYRFGREPNGKKIERYGKKYCWIAWYEIAGFRQDHGKLRREWEPEDNIRFSVDIDPTFPEEIQDIKIISTDYLENKKTNLPVWILKGPTPDISPYLTIESIQDEKGPWILLDGYISQQD